MPRDTGLSAVRSVTVRCNRPVRAGGRGARADEPCEGVSGPLRMFSDQTPVFESVQDVRLLHA